MVIIRDESINDHGAIRRVTMQAFENSEFGHNGEAELIDSLREDCEQSLSLVGSFDENVVAHILFTPVVIRADGRELEGMGLGPMSVATGFQNQGIGSSLVQSGLERLTDDGCPFVVVLGHPEFYSRFGFLPARSSGVSHGFEGIPQEFFFLKILVANSLASASIGAAYYHAGFGPQHTDR